MPNLLKRSEEPIFKEALLSMTNLCHQVCQPEVKGKVFVDAHREAVCASTLVQGNRIEALRLALTNSSSHIVDIHLDGHNCTVDNFKGVINFSRWVLLSDGLWWRLSLIGYSRKSIAGFLQRRDLYMPLVERMCSFYTNLPELRKSISPTLLRPDSFLPHSSDVPSGSGKQPLAKCIKPHANKFVYYSIYIDSISILQQKLELSKWHVLGLVVHTITSETPEYFASVTASILSAKADRCRHYRSLGPVDFSLLFYEKLFDLKVRNRLAGHRVVGQRHQPHYNGKQKVPVVTRSILNFFRFYLATQHLDEDLSADFHFYSKSVQLNTPGNKQ